MNGLSDEIDKLLKTKSIKPSTKIDKIIAERFGVECATLNLRNALRALSAALRSIDNA